MAKPKHDISRTELQEHLYNELVKFGYVVKEHEVNHIAYITMAYLKSVIAAAKKEREGELQ